MEIKPREYWVDITKGIGIIFVMLGHTVIGSLITIYTYVFNMPTFFFLSGYFFKPNKYTDYKEFLKSRIKGILIPYLGLSIISMIFYKFYYHMPFNDLTTIKNMIIVLFTGTRNQIFYNIPLWFLPTLFFVENIFYFIRKLNKIFLEWLIILILGSFFVIKWNTIYNPKLIWTIDNGCFYLIFFALGYYIKQEIFNKNKIKKWVKNITLILAFIINTLVIFNNNLFEKIFKNQFVLDYKIIYFITLVILALSGIYVVSFISKRIKRNKYLEFIGKNSLTFFGLHVLYFWILDKILKPYIQNTIILSIIYVIITLISISILIPYLKKWMPLIFGKNIKKPA